MDFSFTRLEFPIETLMGDIQSLRTERTFESRIVSMLFALLAFFGIPG